MEKTKCFGLLESVLACALCAALFLCAAGVWQQQSLSEKLIRLHVVANSDGEDDQRVKLAVRDAVLAQADALCADAGSAEEAAQRIRAQLPALEKSAQAVLAREGFAYGAEATLGTERFPTREYTDFYLPAGEYASLTLRLGAAEGKNWWCVVFPALCGARNFDQAAEAAGMTPQQIRWVRASNGVEIRFRLVELYQKLAALFS